MQIDDEIFVGVFIPSSAKDSTKFPFVPFSSSLSRLKRWKHLRHLRKLHNSGIGERTNRCWKRASKSFVERGRACFGDQMEDLQRTWITCRFGDVDRSTDFFISPSIPLSSFLSFFLLPYLSSFVGIGSIETRNHSDAAPEMTSRGNPASLYYIILHSAAYAFLASSRPAEGRPSLFER